MTLADKIVVLRDGRIEQVGSPIELYERPANSFVAQFIGSPKMNFFSAGDLSANAGNVLGRTVAASEQVGLRPEHLVVTDAATAVVQGRLELVENLGEYALVHLISTDGVEFIAKTEKPPAAEKGDTIGFTIKPELAHYFDTESGLRS
jgi:multiple sugar transport system ATP-binding protein/alpha-glucoside transport system ATP-binding protein